MSNDFDIFNVTETLPSEFELAIRGQLSVNLKRASEFFSQYDENNPEIVITINKFIDRLYFVTKHSCSLISEKLYKLIGKHIKSNYLVDKLAQIINNKESSYLKQYAMETLVIIDTQYVLEIAIKNNYYNEQINHLYAKNIEQLGVFEFVMEKIKNKSLECEKQIIFNVLHKVIEKKDYRYKIYEAYKHYLTKYNPAYPEKDTPGQLLKIFLSSDYKNEPEAYEMIKIAKNHKSYLFRIMPQKILDHYYDQNENSLREYIEENTMIILLQSALKDKDHDVIFHICKNTLLNLFGESKYDKKKEIISYSSIRKAINLIVNLEMINNLLTEMKIVYERKPMTSITGGLTPFGLTDTKWLPYYSILITLILIGNATDNKEIKDRILNGIDEIIPQDLDVSKYAKMRILGEIDEIKLDLICWHSLHSDVNCFGRYFSYEIKALHFLYDNTDDFTAYVYNTFDYTTEEYTTDDITDNFIEQNYIIKKYIAYRLSENIFTDYKWMREYYSQHIDKSMDIVTTELGELLVDLEIFK